MKLLLAVCWLLTSAGLAAAAEPVESQAVGTIIAAPMPPERPDEPIEVAASKDKADEVRRLFAQASPAGRLGALNYAIGSDDLDLARWLLDEGVTPSMETEGKYDALGTAADLGHIDGIRLLCAHAADPNRPGRLHQRPLHRALASRQPRRRETVAALLACGADPRLHEVSLYYMSGSNEPHYSDEPTLDSVSRGDDVEIARLLLDHGASVTEDDRCCAEKLLVNAVMNPPMFRLLMERGGAAAMAGKGSGLMDYVACTAVDTPWSSPYRAAQLSSLRLLLQAKAALVAEAALEQAPLVCAAAKADPEVVHMLLDAGASVAAATRHDRDTAADLAIRAWERPQDAPWQRDVEAKDVRARALQVMRMLIQHGANPADSEDMWRYPRRAATGADRANDAMARLLEPVVDAWFAAMARDCMAQTPQAGTPFVPVSGPGSTPGGAYPRAAVTVLERLPAPVSYEAATISPDGRWLGYHGDDDEQSRVVLVDLTNDIHQVFEGVRSEGIIWGAGSHSVHFGRSDRRVVDLAGPSAVQIDDKGFEPAPRAGQDACVDADQAGRPLPPMQPASHTYDTPAFSPDRSVRYELVRRGTLRQALVAQRGGQRQVLLVHDSSIWFRKQEADLRSFVDQMIVERHLPPKEAAELRQGLGARDSHGMQAGALSISPTGHYVFYRVAPDGELESAQLVVDVQSRPVRVWCIDVPVESPIWHPNGRELWFVTPHGPESGPPMNRHRGSALAAIAFPP